MAAIGPVSLTIVTNVANATATVTYTLTGSGFDAASGQPYIETCKLVSDDAGVNADIPGGAFPIFPNIIVFPNALPIPRVHALTLPMANLDEDVGPDEIQAMVQLTPIPVSATSRESNTVSASF